MKIGKKLYLNFGAVLAMVVVLFLVNLVAVQREHSAKAAASQALQMAATTDKIRFQMMQNRLYLSNYLLSGDTREVERLNDGMRVLEEKLQAGQNLTTSEQQRTALAKVQASEQSWAREFAGPLMDKAERSG
jgi:CHASE3 domain sensor protein